MASFDPHLPFSESSAESADPVALGRRHAAEEAVRTVRPVTPRRADRHAKGFRRAALYGLVGVLVLVAAGAIAARMWLRAAARGSLPQIDGSLSIAGLGAPVTVLRDAHGVPHIRAATLDDLVFAQGYVTAQDRLWQMETLRRHAAGTLAEVLGSELIPHDRTQRVLQLRAAADRALAVLPPDQMHWLEVYARGVNASIS